MATAVEPGSQPRTPTPILGLTFASLLGAIYVLATIAVVFYAVPEFWNRSVATQLGDFSFVAIAARLVLQIATFFGLLWFGKMLLGDNPPRGVRGGIFLMLVAAALIFLIWRWLALTFETGPGMIVAGVAAADLAFLAFRFFMGRTGEGWMIALEEQGWFSTASYKRSLGVRARRLTMLGIILLGATGVYSLTFPGVLPENLSLTLPFENPNSFTLLPDAQYTVPLLLLGLTLWVAWRAVNLPSFAEFLIATEAEMNKVSWTPKRRLAQDTVVVLTTTLILTLFLLVVDLFWSWLLSHPYVGVLPGKATSTTKPSETERARW